MGGPFNLFLNLGLNLFGTVFFGSCFLSLILNYEIDTSPLNLLGALMVIGCNFFPLCLIKFILLMVFLYNPELKISGDISVFLILDALMAVSFLIFVVTVLSIKKLNNSEGASNG